MFFVELGSYVTRCSYILSTFGTLLSFVGHLWAQVANQSPQRVNFLILSDPFGHRFWDSFRYACNLIFEYLLVPFGNSELQKINPTEIQNGAHMGAKIGLLSNMPQVRFYCYLFHLSHMGLPWDAP